MVRRTGHHHPAGADRQRQLLSQPPVARGLPAAGHHPQADPAVSAATNGKVERFNRTLVEGWAYRRLYTSQAARRAAFGPWLHWYNHHRPHSALGGRPPISRCTNLPEPYT